eukprot:snap_masked-scaffold_24-processed-gene-3.11-mRNA-1 protein AED:1.00 eAED:1.00 QI:0/0/0/0/1/1/2/0/61
MVTLFDIISILVTKCFLLNRFNFVAIWKHTTAPGITFLKRKNLCIQHKENMKESGTFLGYA